jgi:hypothetical protein
MRADAEGGTEGQEFCTEWGWVGRRFPFDGGKEQVFGGVFARDELKDGCPVSVDFEEERADGVCENLGLTLQQDAMAENGFEEGDSGHPGSDFPVATGGSQEERGVGSDAVEEGVVGGGVTGVESEKHVQGLFWREVRDLAVSKSELGEPGFLGGFLGERDQFRALFNAERDGFKAELVEERMGGKGKSAAS